MTEPKLCPLKRGMADDFLVFQNLEVTKEELDKLRKSGAALVKSLNDSEEKIEVVSGLCDGPRCAWWDEERSCCSVVAGSKA